MLGNVVEEMGDNFNPRRFLPFIMMHEFEALLFSDCAAFSRGIYHPTLEPDLRRIRSQFATPEDIDDSPTTAPSKRIQKLLPGYEKRLLGMLAVFQIGLARIRSECPHFNGWLNTLDPTAPPLSANPSQTSDNRST